MVLNSHPPVGLAMRSALVSILICLAAESPALAGEPIVADEPIVGDKPLFAESSPFDTWSLFGFKPPTAEKSAADNDRLTINAKSSSKPSKSASTSPQDTKQAAAEIKLDADYYGNLAKTWVSCQEFDKAIDCLDEAIRLDPNSAICYAYRGLALAGKNDCDGAIDAYDQALRLDPAHAVFRIARAMLLVEAKQFDRALDDFDEALRLDPACVYAYAKRGALWFELRNYDKAIDDLGRAIQLEPTNVPAYRWRAAAWIKKHAYGKSIDDSNEAIRLDALDSDTYLCRSAGHYLEHEFGQALVDLEEAMYLAPHSPAAYNWAAWILATCGDECYRDGRRAVELATRACDSTDRPTAEMYITLGAAYAEIGDFETAIICQDKAIDLNPTTLDVLRGLRAAALYRDRQPLRED